MRYLANTLAHLDLSFFNANTSKLRVGCVVVVVVTISVVVIVYHYIIIISYTFSIIIVINLVGIHV